MITTASEAVAAVDRLGRVLAARLGEVRKRDDYYRGRHRLAYASTKWREFHAERYRDFSDNWCSVVANSPSERLRVTGFKLDDSAAMSGEEQALWGHWQRNDADGQSSQGFLSSIVTGRSAVVVWDDGSGDGVPDMQWDSTDQVVVAYDPARPRRRTAALKTWRDDDAEHATLYTPQALWKFSRPLGVTAAGLSVVRSWSAGGEWRPRDGEDDVWPLPNPLGVVPVVEFCNRPMLGGDPISDIAGTIAMQDAINLLWAYLFNAADFASFPQRVVMGQEPPKIPVLDENGQKVGEVPVDLKKLAQDRLLWLTGQNTSIGSWPAADLKAYTDIVEVAVGHVAAQTRTPQHYLIGKMANLSADALRAAETGLVKKVEESQLFFGPAAREVFRLMALVSGDDAAAAAAATGRVQWRDPESRSEAQLVDALLKLQTIGFPFEWLAERYGLGADELARVVALRESDRVASAAATAQAFGVDGGAGPR